LYAATVQISLRPAESKANAKLILNSAGILPTRMRSPPASRARLQQHVARVREWLRSAAEGAVLAASQLSSSGTRIAQLNVAKKKPVRPRRCRRPENRRVRFGTRGEHKWHSADRFRFQLLSRHSAERQAIPPAIAPLLNEQGSSTHEL
jgi:hypothetical protein